MSTSFSHRDYTVGIVCALAIERAAVIRLLDESHPKLSRKKHDDGAYAYGQLGNHKVVIASLPSGVPGIGAAATVGKDLQRTFPSIQFVLMVGIGGGVPRNGLVRLGDVVVSRPYGQHGGVIQYDFGKAMQADRFIRTGMLNRPPRVLLNAIQDLESQDLLGTSKVAQFVSSAGPPFVHPGQEYDRLFDASYEHKGAPDTCEQCDQTRLAHREARSDGSPRVHYGNIASGSQVMRDAAKRDRLAEEGDVLCFEMEAAGLMDLGCLVIRGISDYADSHKSDRWQKYAAIAAAAFAKYLLLEIPELESESRIAQPSGGG